MRGPAFRIVLGLVLTGMLACGESKNSGPSDPGPESDEAFLTEQECEEVLTKMWNLAAAHYGWEIGTEELAAREGPAEEAAAADERATAHERATAEEETDGEDSVETMETWDDLIQSCTRGELYMREDLSCLRKATSMENLMACQKRAKRREVEALFTVCMSKAKDSLAEGRCYRARASRLAPLQ